MAYISKKEINENTLSLTVKHVIKFPHRENKQVNSLEQSPEI
jgi:hypothetical protein